MADSGVFAAVINCMDGRVQEPVIKWMKENHGVDYVDDVTEPGPICMLESCADPSGVESIRRRVDISVNKHGSRVVAIVAHHDCAGNPVDKQEQLRQLAGSMRTVQDWGYGVQVIGLWVDENWNVQPVAFD